MRYKLTNQKTFTGIENDLKKLIPNFLIVEDLIDG